MASHVFGVDVGGTTVKLGLFDIQGNVLDKWEIPKLLLFHLPTDTGRDIRQYILAIARSLGGNLPFIKDISLDIK